MFPEYKPTDLLLNVKVAVIGPSTEATAVKHGVQVDIVAKEATIESLVETIIAEYQNL